MRSVTQPVRLARSLPLVALLMVTACREPELTGEKTPAPGPDAARPSIPDPPVFVPPTATSGDAGATPTTDAAELTCAEEKRAAELLPVDLYLVQDKSGSMAMSGKWDTVKKSLISFVRSPAVAGLGVGIGFFPRQGSMPSQCPPECTTLNCLLQCGCVTLSCSGNVCTCSQFGPGLSCAAADYATPLVPIEALPGAAQKIVDALEAAKTGGGTPTRPALEGAVEYAKQARAGGKRRLAIALVTDGVPDGCTNNTVATVSAVARAAAMDGILTFVIGVGSRLQNLNALAEAGGTQSAFLVESGANLDADFLKALTTVQNQAARLACSYAIPKSEGGREADPGRVNVSVTSGQPANRVDLLNVGSAAGCGAEGGWYYDDPAKPTEIRFCPQTCTSVNSGTGASEVSILVGCKTRLIP